MKVLESSGSRPIGYEGELARGTGQQRSYGGGSDLVSSLVSLPNGGYFQVGLVRQEPEWLR